MNRPTGGAAATPEQRAQALTVTVAGDRQLADVRTAAGRWQTGLAGLTGTIAIFGLVQGREDVDALTVGWGAAYGVCLALALLCSVAAGLLAMRAAFGLPRVVSTAQLPAPGRAQAREARASAALLRGAVGLTVASVALVAGALACSWYGKDKAKPNLTVRLISGEEECGTVVSVADGTVMLKTSTGQRPVSLADADGLTIVDSCSAGK